MDRVDLATAGLFFSWAAHDLEEYVTMPSASRELAERIDWFPEELRRNGVSREHVQVAMGIMAALFGGPVFLGLLCSRRYGFGR